jgi:hypothetical protein
MCKYLLQDAVYYPKELKTNKEAVPSTTNHAEDPKTPCRGRLLALRLSFPGKFALM